MEFRINGHLAIGLGWYSMKKTIRLLIADNDLEFSNKFRAFLEKQESIRVVELVRDGQGAVNRCRDIFPDMLLMDLHLPVLDSVKAIQLIVTENQQVKIVAMSAVLNDRYALEAIKAGANGYVEKESEACYEHLAAAIQQVAAGEVLLSPTLASSILDEFHRLGLGVN